MSGGGGSNTANKSQQQQPSTTNQQHNNEGKETIQPLIRRSILYRLDVYPFIISYLLLMLCDFYYHLTTTSMDGGASYSVNNIGQTTTNSLSIINSNILIDILYLLLLIIQLIIFLKCQWDTIFYSKVAYYKYTFQQHYPSKKQVSMSVGPAGVGEVENDECDDNMVQQQKKKIEDMENWTHCLVIPPNPYGGSSTTKSSGSGDGDSKASTMQTVRPEKPGIVPVKIVSTTTSSNIGSEEEKEVTSFVAMIHFRGWTYRSCCNSLLPGSGEEKLKMDEHYDLPMESIWHKEDEKKDIEEISDDDENGDNNNSHHSSTSTTSTWEPQFNRLNFPTSLPLSFYTHKWSGQSTSTLLSSTIQIYGKNTTNIPLPPYLSLLTQQLLQPMFLFQLLCVLLWSLDEYWMYAIFTLGTLIMFESLQAMNRWKSVKRLREEVSGGSEGGNSGRKEIVECYRMGEWITIATNELVVGDVISLVSPSIHNKQQMNRQNAIRSAHDHDRGCTIPADLLLLNGRAVVNEAMLTGESVPQVKESIEVGQEDQGTSEQRLDLSDGSTHKRSVLFGGTVLMDHHSSSEDDEEEATSTTQNATSNIPTPPNQGLVCFVLRTGFDTIQGSLLRTLAYHAESGNGGNGGGGEGVNAKETLIFLLILLLCALASAATVVHHAWGDVTRNHFKLILHIVIIITSVIPPELPMELSLAVTTSLSELVKQYQVFCTEPFRIPLAGLVDTCCFDKTGTLTSDELRLHGVRLPSTSIDSTVDSSFKKDDSDLILFDDIKSDSNDDNAGIRSVLPSETLRVMVGCQSLAVTHVYVPGKNGRTTVQAELCGDPLEKAVMEACGYTIHPRTDMVMEKKYLLNPAMNATAEAPSGSIKVLHRFAFSSKLRRMSVLAIDTDSDTLWALTKGAPEALQSMISTLPDDYQQSYLRHMTLGRRVLALAYRNLGKNSPANIAKWKASRDNVEQQLTFAGLLVMDSPLKADSARVIKELRGGNQNVVMVTGDAVLTAAEVARRVGIVDARQESTYELCAPAKGGERFVFRPLGHSIIGTTGKGVHNVVYFPTNPKLNAMVRQNTANFCITGDVLTKLAYHAVESASSSDQTSYTIDDRAVLNHPAARDALSALVPFISVFARHAPRHKEAVIAAFNASGCHTLMCGDGTNDVGALKKAHVGVSIISVPDLEAKQRSANDVISAAKAEEKKERKAAKKKKDGKSSSSSTKSKPKKSRSERVNRSLQALAEAEDELNYVSLGNASVASPFTSRKTSVRCCKDILQQGRCTLVTMIQIYKILGVQCLVNALVLTTLHQKGVKQGDRQLTAVGVVVAILFLFVTRGKPLPTLSTQKPPSSVLCTETLISIAIQFGIHFLAIMSVTYISDAYVDPYDPSIVPDGPFHPNTLNTATFLVTVLSTINAFLVNYRGRPYMESLSENKLLFKSIQGCYFVLFVCAVEIFPPLNQLMQLSPLPTSGPPSFNEEGSIIGTDVDDSFVHDLLLGAVNSVGFQAMLCAIMIADTALVTLAEKSIRSVFGSK